MTSQSKEDFKLYISKTQLRKRQGSESPFVNRLFKIWKINFLPKQYPFWGDGNVLYLSHGYMKIYICQNSSN